LNNLSIFIAISFIILISNFSYQYIEIKGQEIGKILKEKLTN